jgi:hypothetical protein
MRAQEASVKVAALVRLCLISVVSATAESLHLGTAANFKPTLQKLLRDFDRFGVQIWQHVFAHIKSMALLSHVHT